MMLKSKLPSFQTLHRSRWLLLIPLLLLGGCATTAGRATDHCAPWKPIFVSRVDVLTDGTARMIRDHDETGVKLGCWPAPKSAKHDSAKKPTTSH